MQESVKASSCKYVGRKKKNMRPSKQQVRERRKSEAREISKVVYTATNVACWWAGVVNKKLSIQAGAVMQRPLIHAEKAKCDGPTNIAGNKVACMQLNIDIVAGK